MLLLNFPQQTTDIVSGMQDIGKSTQQIIMKHLQYRSLTGYWVHKVIAAGLVLITLFYFPPSGNRPDLDGEIAQSTPLATITKG
jgi:hypothetical protein